MMTSNRLHHYRNFLNLNCLLLVNENFLLWSCQNIFASRNVTQKWLYAKKENLKLKFYVFSDIMRATFMCNFCQLFWRDICWRWKTISVCMILLFLILSTSGSEKFNIFKMRMNKKFTWLIKRDEEKEEADLTHKLRTSMKWHKKLKRTKNYIKIVFRFGVKCVWERKCIQESRGCGCQRKMKSKFPKVKFIYFIQAKSRIERYVLFAGCSLLFFPIKLSYLVF